VNDPQAHRSARGEFENWERLVKRLRDMRAYGGRDYECMDDAADMIVRLVGHVEQLQSAPSQSRPINAASQGGGGSQPVDCEHQEGYVAAAKAELADQNPGHPTCDAAPSVPSSTQRRLEVGRSKAKQAAFDAFYKTAKIVIPHDERGDHDGTFWHALMEGIDAYLVASATRYIVVGEIIEIPDGFGVQPNTKFCEWDYGIKARLPSGTKVYIEGGEHHHADVTPVPNTTDNGAEGK